MHLEDRLEIEAPAAVVWALTADVERWPESTPTMTTVERLDDGPLAVGSQARIKQPAQRERIWTVTRFEEGRAFAWATRAMGMRMEGAHLIEGDATTCTNTLTLDVTGALAPVLGRLLAGQLRKAIATENQGFKRSAEAAAARP
jgi:uncharacterized membrane protein